MLRICLCWYKLHRKYHNGSACAVVKRAEKNSYFLNDSTLREQQVSLICVELTSSYLINNMSLYKADWLISLLRPLSVKIWFRWILTGLDREVLLHYALWICHNGDKYKLNHHYHTTKRHKWNKRQCSVTEQKTYSSNQTFSCQRGQLVHVNTSKINKNNWKIYLNWGKQGRRLRERDFKKCEKRFLNKHIKSPSKLVAEKNMKSREKEIKKTTNSI